MPYACKNCPFLSKLEIIRMRAFITFFCDDFYEDLRRVLQSLLYKGLEGKFGKARIEVKIKAMLDLSSLWIQGVRSMLFIYGFLMALTSQMGMVSYFPLNFSSTLFKLSLTTIFLSQLIAFSLVPRIPSTSLTSFTYVPHVCSIFPAASITLLVNAYIFPISPFQAQHLASLHAIASNS